MDPDAQMRLLRKLAEAVARVVKDAPFAEFGKQLRIGADGTPTKHVDDIAEREILRVLYAEDHKVNLLSEEAGFVDLGGELLLVADPIDGTTNAVRGIPFYCVSLAIGRSRLSDVETGLVMNLATGDVFEAIRGRGATLNGKPIRVSSEPVDGLVGVVALGDRPKGAANLRCFGASALELCLVASGAFDAYHYTRPILRIIDIAAGVLIVREAGGVVDDGHGKPLDLPLSLDPRFILTAACNHAFANKLGGIE